MDTTTEDPQTATDVAKAAGRMRERGGMGGQDGEQESRGSASAASGLSPHQLRGSSRSKDAGWVIATGESPHVAAPARM